MYILPSVRYLFVSQLFEVSKTVGKCAAEVDRVCLIRQVAYALTDS